MFGLHCTCLAEHLMGFLKYGVLVGGMGSFCVTLSCKLVYGVLCRSMLVRWFLLPVAMTTQMTIWLLCSWNVDKNCFVDILIVYLMGCYCYLWVLIETNLYMMHKRTYARNLVRHKNKNNIITHVLYIAWTTAIIYLIVNLIHKIFKLLLRAH